MGLFNFLKGNQSNNDKTTAIDASQFKKELIQEVAIFMNKVGIIDAPMLKFFNNDKGLFEAKFVSMINDPSIKQIKAAMPQMYPMVMGTHSLGTAVHAAACQGRFEKPVEEFGEYEIKQIANDLSQTDAYELALRELGIGLDSNNKKVVDGIVITAINTAQQLDNSFSNKTELLKAFCEVLYNAGVTLAYR